MAWRFFIPPLNLWLLSREEVGSILNKAKVWSIFFC